MLRWKCTENFQLAQALISNCFKSFNLESISFISLHNSIITNVVIKSVKLQRHLETIPEIIPDRFINFVEGEASQFLLLEFS